MTQDPHEPLPPKRKESRFVFLSAILGAALMASILIHYYDEQGEQPTLLELSDGQKSRMNEAYVLEQYFCEDQNLRGKLTHSDAMTTQNVFNLTSSITCYLEKAPPEKFEVHFNQELGMLRVCDVESGVCTGDNKLEMLGPKAP